MSAEAATVYVKKMVQREAKGPGDIDRALERLEQRYGIGRWQLAHLRSGRAKSCEVGLFQRIRFAYLDLCERTVSKLEHEIAIERATEGTGDASLESLEAEAAALAQKIAEAKARQKGEAR